MTDSPHFADIGILIYPGAQLAAVHGLTDMFLTANQLSAEQGVSGVPVLRVSHWVLDETGAVVVAYKSHDQTPKKLTALILPPSLGPEPLGERLAPILRWLKSQHVKGATLCSVCAGAFLLAESGLLAGRPATTHWSLAERLAERFPDILVDADKLVIEDGDIITAGGIMAWVELGLKLIDRLISPAIVLATARFFLVDPAGREQRFYSSFAPKLHHGDAAILKMQHWLQANATNKVTLPLMATQAGLGERTFLRRFQKATGLNPTRYLQHLRIGKAREMLEFSPTPVEQIAWQIGYEDAGAFSKVFQASMGLTPSDYRRRFSVGGNRTRE
nr:GlxA family transcriptional regulator [uncultured Dongia sp.]